MSTSVAVTTSEDTITLAKGTRWLVEDGLLTVLDAGGIGIGTFRDWNNVRLIAEE